MLRSIRKIYQFFVDTPIKEGTVLNARYEVLSVIGKGSYGITYLCKDLKTSDIRVIKQLRPSKRKNKKEVALFENEIVVLKMLNHNNMPKLYDTFKVNSYVYYTMSYIEGDNLEEHIFFRRKIFKEREALLLLSRILNLVDYLHKQQISHGDLRIPNILINENEPFLIDFGLSNFSVSSTTSNQESFLEMKQQDYYDLGEILLYLLYTTYSSKNKKALPWTEELTLTKETGNLLKRLLQMKEPYLTTANILTDLHLALRANEKMY